MIPGYIGKEIRRTNRILVFPNLFCILLIVVASICCTGYLRECFTGPFEISAGDIARLDNADQAPHQFVRLHIDPARVDNTVYHISGGQDNNQNDWYHFLHLDNGRVLIIKSNSQTLPDEIKGALTSWTWLLDVTQKVMPGVQNDVKGPFSNVLIDTSDYRVGAYFIFGLGISMLGLVTWSATRGIMRMRNPLRHPLARQLAKFGPPEEIAVAIDAEYRTSAERTGKVILTQSWLMRPGFNGVVLVYLGDVVWAYKTETKVKAHGVVTVGRTFSTMVYLSDGKSREFQLKEKQVQDLLAELARRVPWAIIGYSPELLSAWKNQRPQFLANVAERKRQVAGAGAQGNK